ncbi:MAG: cell division protein FtsQ/DivIB [Actinomycetota bacterium]
MALGALVYQGATRILESEALEVRVFEVRGNSGTRVSDRELIRASGVEVRAKLLKISTEEVERRLERIPWLDQVEAQRILPSTLHLSVSERAPNLVVWTQSGPFMVDKAGIVLAPGREAGLIELFDLPLPGLQPGYKVSTPEYLQADTIINGLPRSLRVKIGSVQVPTMDQITLRLLGGPMISYGTAENLEDKNFVLEALLEESKHQRGQVAIDVRVPLRPTVKIGN